MSTKRARPSVESLLHSSASSFKRRDIDALKVRYQTASESNVIPAVEARGFPDKYVVPGVDRQVLERQDLDINQLGITNNHVNTFIRKLNRVVVNAGAERDTAELLTDSLVLHLLIRAMKMDCWPLLTDVHPQYCLFIDGEPYVSAVPEFVIKKENCTVAVIEHFKNAHATTGFGETQIAAEMLSCASMNIQAYDNKKDYTSQLIFAVRVISSCVTFYKAVISVEYLQELDKGLPVENSVVIERWPGEGGRRDGLDLANPAQRRRVLEALTKIRHFLCQ
ncbi:6401_t:CDS:2 [Paraglomus occultum]|uniref:6401_t:CDS:1 n=1 Tax=Paraglomus occultum TaxID=144539 RepID=A0A9N8VWY4_9GLOM|nr:6401_t:CDS:2 [Paraglomus occultum]